jgi:riboflavin-specific deaminase-like protein
VGRPFVTIHYAQTLDGRIAARTGDSQWIGGEASLRYAHELRAAHEAVMVGVGTVLVDNPHLTVRLVSGQSPLRIIADSTLRLPLNAHVLTDGAVTTIVVTTARAPTERIQLVRAHGAEVLSVKTDDEGHVDLIDLLRYLARRGISSLLIEGGRGLITSTLRQRLANRLVVCIAPKVIGMGIEAVGDLYVQRLSEALTFTRYSFTPLGGDILFDGQFNVKPW